MSFKRNEKNTLKSYRTPILSVQEAGSAKNKTIHKNSFFAERTKTLVNDQTALNDSAFNNKEEPHVLEWSGVLELVTPWDASAEKVKKATLHQINKNKKITPQNYRRLLLVNLPNLTQTPRYQNKNRAAPTKPVPCKTGNTNQLSIKFRQLKKRRLRLKTRGLLIKKMASKRKKQAKYNQHRFFTDFKKIFKQRSLDEAQRNQGFHMIRAR